jgi:hypothetical protein
MDDMPPRVIIRPDGHAPVTVPDELKAEWDNMPIWREQEYIRADIAAAALEAKDAEIARLRALLEDLTGEAENDTETPYFKVALFNARAALQAKE